MTKYSIGDILEQEYNNVKIYFLIEDIYYHQTNDDISHYTVRRLGEISNCYKWYCGVADDSKYLKVVA